MGVMKDPAIQIQESHAKLYALGEALHQAELAYQDEALRFLAAAVLAVEPDAIAVILVEGDDPENPDRVHIDEDGVITDTGRSELFDDAEDESVSDALASLRFRYLDYAATMTMDMAGNRVYGWRFDLRAALAN